MAKKQIKGLKAGYSKGSIDRRKPGLRKLAPGGWYIYAWLSGEWRPYLPLRYRRRRDAELGAQALQDAGIDSIQKITKAGHDAIRVIAAQYYEW
jgi:hypothetical protein